MFSLSKAVVVMEQSVTHDEKTLFLYSLTHSINTLSSSQSLLSPIFCFGFGGGVVMVLMVTAAVVTVLMLMVLLC